jgi:hypothetical protein
VGVVDVLEDQAGDDGVDSDGNGRAPATPRT